MSFFGFETGDLEKEKQAFLGGVPHNEDLSVYNLGQDDYDGLGNALQEGGDELNDETFGGSGPVGKDFDFTSHALPTSERQHTKPESPHFNSGSFSPSPSLKPTQPSRPTHSSRESIWDNKSPFSVLPRVGSGGARSVSHQSTASVSSRMSPYTQAAPLRNHNQSPPVPSVQASAQDYAASGVHTLQEIEAEMRARSQQTRFQQTPSQSIRQKPPRMQSQSPVRVPQNYQQNSILYQQQLHQQLLEQERIRAEELEWQYREQLLAEELALREREQRYLQEQQLMQLGMLHKRQVSSLDQRQLQQLQLQQQQQAILNASSSHHDHHKGALSQIQQQLPQYAQNVHSAQLQQRMLAQLAQAQSQQDYAQHVNGVSAEEQEALRVEAMRKIMEAERMEGKRRRKAAKIAHMSRYNDLMTQSDKDFITRIQVSQLVTADPYTEDFYAQVYGSLLRSRMGLGSQEERVLKFGSGEGIALGVGQRASGRKPSAIQRMEAQVERIVNNARLREKEKGLHAIQSLQGALGRTAGRSYKAAPRQLLQFDESAHDHASPTLSHAYPHISKEDAKDQAAGAAKEAAKRGTEALGSVSGHAVVRRDPLTHRETLIILEQLYDILLNVEQLRRDQPPPEMEEEQEQWNAFYDAEVKELWDGLRVMVPLEISTPHPFVSLIMPAKGKKLLPRLTRHLDNSRLMTLLTLLVACFSQLDVVVGAPLLDSLEDTPERREVEQHTQSFLTNVLQSILQLVAKSGLRLFSALIAIFLERSDVALVVRSRPGLALLTLFLSRVEVIKQNILSSTQDAADPPSDEEWVQWQNIYDHLFYILTPHLISLFPSSRIVFPSQVGAEGSVPSTDVIDQPVWQFLAALALHANNEQQQILVASLRDKVIDNLYSVAKGWVADESDRSTKIANVNLFLHALGLDSSQISL